MNIVEVITTIIEAGVLEPDRFQAILARHHLHAGWRDFSRLYLNEPS